jgi:hypothetical protein
MKTDTLGVLTICDSRRAICTNIVAKVHHSKWYYKLLVYIERSEVVIAKHFNPEPKSTPRHPRISRPDFSHRSFQAGFWPPQSVEAIEML